VVFPGQYIYNFFVAAVSPVQALIRNVLTGAAEALPKEAGWSPSMLSAATSALEVAVLKALPQRRDETDHLQKLFLALTLAVQTATALAAAHARALVAASFTYIWDELTHYPGDYGLTAAGTPLVAAAPAAPATPTAAPATPTAAPATSTAAPGAAANANAPSEADEHYKPVATSTSDYEAWGKAFNFAKTAIKPSTA